MLREHCGNIVATIEAASPITTAPKASGWSGFSRAAVRVGLVALAFLLACNEISDYDIWWHLRTGQLIPERGIPSTDWYSFTSTDRPWIDVHWGFQLIVASLHALAGVPGLVLLQACIIATTMTIALTAYRREWSVWPQFGVLLVALLVMSSRFYVRPEIFTLLFTSIFLTVLLHAEQRPRLLWILPAVQVLWANVQSLFVFGPILLGMYWVEVVLRGRGYKGQPKRLAIVSGLVGLACIVSPYGIWNVMFLADVWQKMDPEAGKFYRATIGELKDLPSFLAEGGWRAGAVYILFLMMLLGAVGVAVRWREIVFGREFFRFLPVVAFTWLAWQAMRNASHFALVVGILTAWNLGPSFPRKASEFRIAWVTGILSLVIGVYFVGGRLSEWMSSHRRFGFGTHPEQFSFEAMRICALPGMPSRAAIFHMGHAATYIYACGPDRKVLMDPRLEVHTEQTLRDYRDLERELDSGTNGPRMLDRFGVDLVVAGGEQNVGIQATLLSSPYWKCIHWDSIAAVFVRSTLKLPAGVEEFDFRKGLFDSPEFVLGNMEEAASYGSDLWERFSAYLPFLRRIDQFIENTGPSFLSNITPNSPRMNFRQLESIRLFNLAQSLAGKPSLNEILVRRVAWRSFRRAIRVENIQALKESLKLAIRSRAIIAMLDHVNETKDNSVYSALSNETTLQSLRAQFSDDSGDITTGFYLQQLLADTGALDDSVVILEKLSKHKPINPAQESVMPQIIHLLQTRKKIVNDPNRQPSAKVTTWDDIRTFRSFNRLGTLAKLISSMQNERISDSLSPDQSVVLGRWMMGIGSYPVFLASNNSSAYELLKSLATDSQLPLATDQNMAIDLDLFSVQTAMFSKDDTEFRKRLNAIDPDKCTPAQKKILARFRDLLIDVPDKR